MPAQAIAQHMSEPMFLIQPEESENASVVVLRPEPKVSGPLPAPAWMAYGGWYPVRNEGWAEEAVRLFEESTRG